ncbi:MAG: hypothetical protein NZ699_03430 [Roseiflexus sp.]|nr:hypothetical protein [Roseiflexus sp.]MCS7288164.1 hypothetical protein [Roseiflexus sp.]MDW8145972.1 hypothetical protein [Roseiflexaceae bacterium]MDW8232987.1 hypothetical protein [Roseiflexaceae bacterium]
MNGSLPRATSAPDDVAASARGWGNNCPIALLGRVVDDCSPAALKQIVAQQQRWRRARQCKEPPSRRTGGEAPTIFPIPVARAGISVACLTELMTALIPVSRT